MALTLSGTNGVVGAGFTVDASGVSVTAGVGTFGSLAAPAAGLTGALPALNAASLTSIPAANIVGLATAGFERSGGFGKIVNVYSASSTTAQSSQSTSYVDITNITLTLTPAATNKCFVHVALNGYTEGTSTFSVTNSYSLLRDSTEIAKQVQNIRLDNSMSINYLQNGGSIVMAILDTHGKDGSTSVTYKVQGKTNNGYFHINSSYNTQSSITVYEVAPN